MMISVLFYLESCINMVVLTYAVFIGPSCVGLCLCICLQYVLFCITAIVNEQLNEQLKKSSSGLKLSNRLITISPKQTTGGSRQYLIDYFVIVDYSIYKRWDDIHVLTRPIGRASPEDRIALLTHMPFARVIAHSVDMTSSTTSSMPLSEWNVGVILC